MFINPFTPNPYAIGDLFVQYKMMQKKTVKWPKPLDMGTHLRVLTEGYLMNTNMTGFKCFSKIFASLCFGWKDRASALEGLRVPPEIVVWIYDTFDDNFGTENGFTKIFEGKL